MTSLHCNKCYQAFEPGGISKAVTTCCGHMFCPACSEATFPLGKDGGTFVAQCPICDETLMKSNLKVVPVLANASDIKMALFGQSPEAVMQTALEAINFYMVQQQVVSNFRETRLADKAIQMKDQCNSKLAEVHGAYQNAKRKYQAAMQEKNGLEQETRELQDKYRQKSKQNQELQRMYKELQMRNDSARRGGSGSATMAMNNGLGSPGLSLSGGSGGPVGSGGQMVTTIQRSHHQTFSLGGLTPPRDMLMGPDGGGSPLMFGVKPSGKLSLPPMMRASPSHSSGQHAAQRQQMLQGCLPGALLGSNNTQLAKLQRSRSIGQMHQMG